MMSENGLSMLVDVFMVYASCLWMTAWSTLMERKLLAGAQFRKGPNKIFLKGVMQPVADAIKLFTKEAVCPSKSNVYPFFVVPLLSLAVTFAMWHLWAIPHPPQFFQYGIIFYMCLSSVHIYGAIIGGWVSNSAYSMIGAMRGIFMAISYEIPLAVVVAGLCFQLMSWDMHSMGRNAIYPMVLLSSWAFPPLIVCFVAEMHRAPFDLIEAESELVSGFNTDYGSAGFLLFFVSEYGSMVFGSQVISWLWFWPFHWVWSTLVGVLICCLILFARSAFPRVKCEMFMESCWKSYLPVSMLFLVVSFVLGVMV